MTQTRGPPAFPSDANARPDNLRRARLPPRCITVRSPVGLSLARRVLRDARCDEFQLRRRLEPVVDEFGGVLEHLGEVRVGREVREVRGHRRRSAQRRVDVALEDLRVRNVVGAVAEAVERGAAKCRGERRGKVVRHRRAVAAGVRNVKGGVVDVSEERNGAFVQRPVPLHRRRHGGFRRRRGAARRRLERSETCERPGDVFGVAEASDVLEHAARDEGAPLVGQREDDFCGRGTERRRGEAGVVFCHEAEAEERLRCPLCAVRSVPPRKLRLGDERRQARPCRRRFGLAV
mmetsp:Transcript_14433/g.51301  ORF Transcript_14433/g.51301 Transcript_14433/m.51301 type:complete len:291 (+) Transcript_14433:323-1195(+)